MQKIIGDFIVQDLKPISVVEVKGFKQLMTIAEHHFNIPSMTYFSQNVIPKKYVALQSELEAFLDTIQFCSITTDQLHIK